MTYNPVEMGKVRLQSMGCGPVIEEQLGNNGCIGGLEIISGESTSIRTILGTGKCV